MLIYLLKGLGLQHGTSLCATIDESNSPASVINRVHRDHGVGPAPYNTIRDEWEDLTCTRKLTEDCQFNLAHGAETKT